MKEKIAQLLINQVIKELESSYLYYDMYKYYLSKSLKGFAFWFKKQASEEVEHANKFIEYLTDNDIEFKLQDIKHLDSQFSDLKDPLTLQLKHEKKVTSLIHTIYEEAHVNKDYSTTSFLDYFLKEQIEEENTAKELLDKYELLATSTLGLYELDKELSKRE